MREDDLGSIIGLVDDTFSMSESYAYDEFGNEF